MSSGGCERSLFGFFAGFVLAVMHLSDEGLRLLVVGERKTGGAFLELERVKKGSVLVVGEIVVDLLIPNHTLSSGL